MVTMDKNIKKQLIKTIFEKVPNLVAVTGGMGISYGENKKFYQDAKDAAQYTKTVKKDDVIWVPLQIKNKVELVIGYLDNKKGGVNKKLLEGLYDEIKYKHFLNEQVLKFSDPKGSFIKNLLTKTEIKNIEQAIDRGDIVGVNLRSPQAIYLIKAPGFKNKIKKNVNQKDNLDCLKKLNSECNKIKKVISSGFQKNEQNIITHLEDDLFVLLKSAGGTVNTLNSIEYFKKKAGYIKELVEKITGLGVTIGIGQYYPGIEGLRKSFADAKSALEIGIKIWGEDKIYHITDIGMFITLSEKVSQERKCELANQILGEILTKKDNLKTVNEFLKADMNLTIASKNLHLHRNTLIYRLENIKKITGLDPRKFRDAVQIKMGLMLYTPEEK